MIYQAIFKVKFIFHTHTSTHKRLTSYHHDILYMKQSVSGKTGKDSCTSLGYWQQRYSTHLAPTAEPPKPEKFCVSSLQLKKKNIKKI